jgi:hypothetical protein
MPESRGRKPKKQNAAAAQTGKAGAAQSNIAAACQFTKADGSKCKRIVQSASKYCWQHAHGLRAKLRALPRKPAVTFALAVAGLLIPIVLLFEGSTLMGLLPGPNALVTIQGLRMTSGNEAGCLGYMVSISTANPSNDVIEALYLTVQFPKNIASYKFGAANASVLARAPQRVWLTLFELGKDATGECSVVQAAVAPSPDLTATIAGPGMVQMRGTRILPRTVVQGYFALSVKDASFQPPTMFTEGSYEYTRFGFTVSKPLTIQDTGIHDAK